MRIIWKWRLISPPVRVWPAPNVFDDTFSTGDAEASELEKKPNRRKRPRQRGAPGPAGQVAPSGELCTRPPATAAVAAWSAWGRLLGKSRVLSVPDVACRGRPAPPLGPAPPCPSTHTALTPRSRRVTGAQDNRPAPRPAPRAPTTRAAATPCGLGVRGEIFHLLSNYLRPVTRVTQTGWGRGSPCPRPRRRREGTAGARCSRGSGASGLDSGLKRMIKTVTVWPTRRDELGVLYKAGQFRFPTRRDSEGLAQDFEMKDGITMFLRDTKMPLKNNCLLLRGLSKRPEGHSQHFE